MSELSRPLKLPDAPSPFVLIDDARERDARRAKLYRDPVEVVEARSLAQVVPALERLRQARERGLHAAGYIGYDAGAALERRLERLDRPAREGDAPSLWFGLFRDVQEIAPEDVSDLFPAPVDVGGPLRPLISQEDYGAAFARVMDYIRAGDIYQANLTFPCEVPFSGDARALYGMIRPRAAAGHGALVMTGTHWLLSFSPELFFTLDGQVLTARPMKGTAARSDDGVQDAAHADALREDPKQRAENLMIVDLLRNDLSRVAEPGSVRVPHLFAIESYPTVHHMTSTVTAHLREGLDAIDAIRALFPCGSITGAPKVRAMEIIDAVEARARGPYTGSIGTIDPDGDAAFNVAIRTICVKDGDDHGILALGSGIVADSQADDEWQECLRKGQFLSGLRTER
nr:aminodeoxychorismate synthase component I [Sphingobium subterraneum]